MRVERDDVRRVQTGRARDLNAGVVLAGDDVRRRDDEIPGREPAAPFDADAARGPEHAHDVARGLANRGVACELAARRLARRRRPHDRGERVDAREQLQETPRRNGLIEAPHDLGLLHVPPEARLSRDEQRRRAEHPDEDDPGDRAKDEAAERIEEPQRGEPQATAHERAGDARGRLEEDRPEHGADEPGERRVPRAGAPVQEVRRDT